MTSLSFYSIVRTKYRHFSQKEKLSSFTHRPSLYFRKKETKPRRERQKEMAYRYGRNGDHY